MPKFHELLKKARLAKGYTQKQTAEKVGVTLVSYQRWEYDMRIPESQYLLKLITVLELDAVEVSRNLEDAVKT